MKTYTKTKVSTEPLLVIEHDEYSTSPREWSNLGYFITVDRNYRSPDQNERLENIVKISGEIAKDQADHIRLIKENYRNVDDHIIAIYPIVKYEHSGVVYRLGTAHGFDYSNNGFYIITDKTQKEVGTKKKDFEKVIKNELEVFNKWINGECYQFCLYNEQGEVDDSCGGFYSVEDIREYLPKEWKDEDLSVYIK
jgi:hypothetical protein